MIQTFNKPQFQRCPRIVMISLASFHQRKGVGWSCQMSASSIYYVWQRFWMNQFTVSVLQMQLSVVWLCIRSPHPCPSTSDSPEVSVRRSVQHKNLQTTPTSIIFRKHHGTCDSDSADNEQLQLQMREVDALKVSGQCESRTREQLWNA